MFALKKVPKIHAITHFLSDDEHSLPLISGCKHGRLKISSLALTCSASLHSNLVCYCSRLRVTRQYTHTNTVICKCKNREQGYSTLSEGGLVCVGVRFSEVCRSQPLCAMERVSDVQNNKKQGEGMLHSAVLHYIKNEEAFMSSIFDAGIVRFVLLRSIYCMYQNIYKGVSLGCAQLLAIFSFRKVSQTHARHALSHSYVQAKYKYVCVCV